GINSGISSLGPYADPSNTATARSILNNDKFRNIILSLVSTFGLYLISSLMMLDPWHIFTCAFISLFANSLLYAIYSWGNRPETPKESGSKEAKDVKSSTVPTVEVSVPEDINSVYQLAVQEVRRKSSKEVTIATPKQKREDSRKSFRTKVVLAWVFSNIILITIISSLGNSQASVIDGYMAFILWSVAGLAAFRFF
ncbi:7964_t:CDS:2, partial [Gigaspora rosea]